MPICPFEAHNTPLKSSHGEGEGRRERKGERAGLSVGLGAQLHLVLIVEARPVKFFRPAGARPASTGNRPCERRASKASGSPENERRPTAAESGQNRPLGLYILVYLLSRGAHLAMSEFPGPPDLLR